MPELPEIANCNLSMFQGKLKQYYFILMLIGFPPAVPVFAGEGRGYDLSSISPDRTLSLTDGWYYQPGTIQTDFLPETGRGHWTGMGSLTELPESSRKSSGSYGWFQKRILYRCEPGYEAGLFLTGIGRPYILYLDDTVAVTPERPFVHNSGSLPETLVPLPGCENGEYRSVLITIRALLENGRSPFHRSLEIGNRSVFLKQIHLRLYIVSAISGIFLFFSIYQFLLYLYRLDERFHLFSSLFAATLAGRLMIEVNQVMDLFPVDIPALLLLRLVSLPVISLAFTEFLFDFFEFSGKFALRMFRIISALTIVVVLLVFDPSHYLKMVLPIQVLSISGLLIPTILAMRDLLRVRFETDRLLSIAGGISLMTGMGVDFYIPESSSGTIIITVFGSMAIVVFLSLSIISRYIKLFTSTQKLKEDLDYLVHTRTEELEQAIQQIHSDLEIARRFQSSLLPTSPHTGLDTAYRYMPFNRVSGDILDITVVDQSLDRFFIADAMGHGVHASLATMVIKLLYDRCKNLQVTPAQILEIIQNAINVEYSGLGLHFTAFVLDIYSDGKIQFASAGHPPQFLLRAGGEIEFLNAKGSMITRHFRKPFANGTNRLNPGDRFILFTDGLTEVRNEKGEMLDDTGFALLVRESLKPDPQSHIVSIINGIELYAGKRGLEDDTLLLIGLKKARDNSHGKMEKDPPGDSGMKGSLSVV